MVAYLILILAVVSRFVPHWLHTPAWGVTALGGGLLCFGSRLPGSPGLRGSARWQALLVVPAVALSDYLLTTQVYGFPFHWTSYVVPWCWYVAVALLGAASLGQRRSVLRVAGAAVLSSTGFFLLSNGMVWLEGSMYPKTAGGLLICYTAGLPFYRNDTIATLAVCGVFFGLPAVARTLSVLLERAPDSGTAA